jgi:predicted RNA-binding protein YlxR (DUF448 family)
MVWPFDVAAAGVLRLKFVTRVSQPAGRGHNVVKSPSSVLDATHRRYFNRALLAHSFNAVVDSVSAMLFETC